MKSLSFLKQIFIKATSYLIAPSGQMSQRHLKKNCLITIFPFFLKKNMVLEVETDKK